MKSEGLPLQRPCRTAGPMLALLSLLAAALAPPCGTAGTAAPWSFCVATNGNDAWSGRLDAPDAAGRDGPFATLARARDAVRALAPPAAERTAPVVVRVRGGTYVLRDTLVFETADSGTERAPVVYEAAPGEEPLLSGGAPLSGWRETAPGRWEVQLPAVAEGKWNFSQLYVNDQRRPRPVLPKEGYFSVERPLPIAAGANPDRFGFRAGDLRADWHNRGDVELLTFHLWTMDRLRIKDVDETRRTVTLAGASHSSDQAPLTPATWYRVENVREALAQPGEWYLDHASGVLTYLAKPGEDVPHARIVAPRLGQLVRFAGDTAAGRFVDHLVLRGLTFAHAGWNTPARGYGFPQADVALDGALTAVNARHCALERCVVRHTGGWAVDWSDGCQADRVEGCELFDLGTGGVKIGPTPLGEERDARKWAGGCVVRDCLIAHGGRVLPAGVGVWIGHAASNTVERNEIADFYYSAVSVGWKWGAGFSAAHHNAIVGNHLHDLGQGVLSDMGGIYTLGESPGTVLRGNRIHDVARARYGGWGIYFDEGSSNVVAEGNAVYRTQDAGLHQNYGRGNTVRNNIFAFGTNGLLRLSDISRSSEMLFEHNLFYAASTNLFELDHLHDAMIVRSNLYWSAAGGAALRFLHGAPFETWKQRDPGAVLADPLFAAPEQGDFTLRAGSPAAQAGFVPFDLSANGRLTKGNRTDALPVPPRVFPPAPDEREMSARLSVDDDYESSAPGQRPLLFVADAYDGATVDVSADAAAGGQHSLKFREGTGGASWIPHIYLKLRYERGEVRNSFDFRAEPGARMNWEWRDWPDTGGGGYRHGPSLTVEPDGALVAAGQKRLVVPAGQWVHLDIVCRLGSGADGTWRLAVTLPGLAQPQVFDRLPVQDGFRAIDWVGFSSLGAPGTVFYVDNFKLSRSEP